MHFQRLLRRLKVDNRQVRANSTSPQEVKIPVPWGHVAGKWWGPTDQRPVLSLHGWQDNCGSFNRLLPLLNQDVGFLAIDFPGHGLSSRIPSGLYCHTSDYFILIQYLMNYFKWPKVSLMGHSMGGTASFKYTVINPQNVDLLICIDGTKPMYIPHKIAEAAQFLTEFPKYAQHEIRMSNEEPPSHTIEEIKRKLCIPNNNSVAYEHSHHIAERNIAPSKKHPGKYFFTRDPRLKGSDLMNWPQKDAIEGAKRVTCPVFIAKAIDGPYYEDKKLFYEVVDVLRGSSVDCQYHRFEGTHHMHLNNPEVLAGFIKIFIDKHNTTERDIGGIRDGIRN